MPHVIFITPPVHFPNSLCRLCFSVCLFVCQLVTERTNDGRSRRRGRRNERLGLEEVQKEKKRKKCGGGEKKERSFLNCNERKKELVCWRFKMGGHRRNCSDAAILCNAMPYVGPLPHPLAHTRSTPLHRVSLHPNRTYRIRLYNLVHCL